MGATEPVEYLRINSVVCQPSSITRFKVDKKKNRHEKLAIFPFVSLIQRQSVIIELYK